MAWTNKKGFNFRATLGYVTDGANERHIDHAATYPTSVTIDGDTFDVGWSSGSPGSANRDSAVDPRLAGIVYMFGSTAEFTVDLPASGNYIVSWAFGDATDPNLQIADLLDNTTVLLSIAPETATSAGEFIDATEVKRTSAADWVTNQAEATVTFATTVCKIRLNVPSGSAVTIAHFAIRQATSGSQGAARYALSQMM